MSDSEEKNEQEKSEKKEQESSPDKNAKQDAMQYKLVDDKGRTPGRFMLPVYLVVGVVFVLIWVLIYFLLVVPTWKEYEKLKATEQIQTQPQSQPFRLPTKTIKIKPK